MFVIIGLVVLSVCIVVGFVIEHGNPMLFFQPVEMLIILGAAAGSFIIANPMKVIKHVAHSIPHMLKGKSFSKKDYMDLLTMLFDILSKMKKEGILAIESDIETPAESELSRNTLLSWQTMKRSVFCVTT